MTELADEPATWREKIFYGGVVAVQELDAGTPSANSLNGGTDEVLARTDSTSTLLPLSDAVGNTVALVNWSGSIVTEYTYELFGNTMTSGISSSHSSQYAGRENDGNGLYYYRSRYYSPRLQRFISEDPLGLRAGTNPYAYVNNNPVNSRDPLGLWSPEAH